MSPEEFKAVAVVCLIFFALGIVTGMLVMIGVHNV